MGKTFHEHELSDTFYPCTPIGFNYLQALTSQLPTKKDMENINPGGATGLHMKVDFEQLKACGASNITAG